MRATSIILSFLLAASALLYGCQSKPETKEGQTSNDQLTIYTTVYPLEDFTKKTRRRRCERQKRLPAGS